MKIKQGSMGKAVPGVPVEVIDDAGCLAQTAQEGDITVLATNAEGKLPSFLYRGYMSKDGQMSMKSRPRLDPLGIVNGEWYLTGDRAYKDGEDVFGLWED